MFWTHFHLLRHPFRPRHSDDLYRDAGIAGAERDLFDIIQEGELACLSGPAGAGKTTLIDAVIHHLDIEPIYVRTIPRTRLTGGHIAQAIIRKLSGRWAYGSLEHRSSRMVDELIDLHQHNRQAVLILDNADDLKNATLRDIDQIHEACGCFSRPLSVVIAGESIARRLERDMDLRGLYQSAAQIEAPQIDDPGQFIAHAIEGAGGRVAEIFPSDVLGTFLQLYPTALTPGEIGRIASELMMWACDISEPITLNLITSVHGDARQEGVAA